MGCAGSAPRPNDAGLTSTTLGAAATQQPQAQLTAAEAVDLSLQHGEAEGVSTSPDAGVGVSSSGKAASTSASKYFSLDGLMEPVESGAIAPIKGSWLVAQHERGGGVVKRQDMPAEAFWTAATPQSGGVLL